ncbi:MAG: hypothetical protein ACP5SB_00730 [Caldisericaceae bacterium]
MKRLLSILLVFVLLLIAVLVAFSPLLPESSITVSSNIPLNTEDIFLKTGLFYFTYFPKLPVSVDRKLLKVSVSYVEAAKYNIKFSDGIFGITKDGWVVKEPQPGLKTINAKFESSKWNSSFRELFLVFESNDFMDKVSSFCFFQNYVAFFDKNDILNIMGDRNYSEKIQEYLKTISLFTGKLEAIKQIDFRFDKQSVIIWR